ncbi:MAG: hypothetical protein IH942_07320 [Acidobacteria bacterium]|nr:hypothetical protein [Acidobacteriota bacterium]
MTWSRLVQAELRKLTSTRMPWAFLAVLVAISATTATAVIFGTDMDGSKAFIATAGDQQSLMAFAANAMMIAALFGAIAVAREYGHGTVIPTFLTAPRRHRAVLAQLTAVMVGGGLLGLVGAALTGLAVTLALPMTEYNDAAFLEQMVTVQRSEAAGSRSRRHPATGGASGHLVHRKAEDDRRVSTNLGRADPTHRRVLGVERGPEPNSDVKSRYFPSTGTTMASSDRSFSRKFTSPRTSTDSHAPVSSSNSTLLTNYPAVPICRLSSGPCWTLRSRPRMGRTR